MRVTPYIILISIFFCSCNTTSSGSGDQDPQAMFEEVWTNFDQLYPYFELKGVDWDSVLTVNINEISESNTEGRLLEIMSDITLSLRDVHVNVRTPSGQFIQFQKRDLFAPNLPNNAFSYLTDVSLNNSSTHVGRIDNTNITYIRIISFGGDVNDFVPLYDMMPQLSNSSAWIIDVRENPGGNDALGRAIAERLTDMERTYENVRFRDGDDHNDFEDWTALTISPNESINFNKPIVVLTNRGTYSSAESFVLMMDALPNTTLVGDTTGGASANPRQFTLANGWTYTVSTWQAATPDFMLIEDHGIAPDEVVNNTESTFNNGRDLMLERAIELLTQQANPDF